MTGSFIKRNRFLIGGLLAVCLAVFLNTLPNAFVWDDLSLIPGDRYLRHLRNIPLFFTPHYWNALQPYADFEIQYRPLRTMTFAIDYLLWGTNPAGYHVTNLLLHMANVVLIFYLISALGDSAGVKHQGASLRGRLLMGLPFLTAALFAVHPIHTESVTYIKNRSDLLAFLFFLAAFLLFIRNRTSVRRLPGLLLLIGSLLCFVLSVLSKEMALTLPAVLALYALCFQDKKERAGTFIRVIPFCLMILLYFWFIRTMLHNPDLSPDSFQISAGRHVLAIVKTIGVYLSLLAFPVHLNADRSFFIPASFREPAVLLSLTAMAAISVAAVTAWRRSRIVFFAIAYLLLTLLPAANIVFLESRPIAEQRLYIPSLGFCLILAWLIHRLYQYALDKNFSRAGAALPWLAAGLVLLGFSVRTIYRNLDWRDPLTFYTRTIKSSPDSSKIHNSLGVFLSEQGQRENAVAHYETALRLNPDYSQAYNNLGVALSETGRREEAVRMFREALRLDPGYASAHYNLGAVLLEAGSVEDAIRHYETAVRLKPDTDMLNNLGSAYATAGRLEEAVDHYLAALRLVPDFTLALDNLGAVLMETGNIEQTIDRILSPVLAPWQLARVYNRVATIYLKAEELSSAVTYYRQALRLDPDYSEGLFNLGLALTLEKEYQEAAGAYARLLAISPTDKNAREGYDYCLKMAAGGSE